MMMFNFTQMVSKMKIAALGLTFLFISACGVHKYDKIRFVKQQRTTKSIIECEELSTSSNVETSKLAEAQENAELGNLEPNARIPVKNNSGSTDPIFSLEEITHQLVGSTYTEKQRQSSENEFKETEKGVSKEIKTDENEKQGISPPLFAVLLILLILAILLFGLLTFLSFSLGNGSSFPLLLVTILCIVLLVVIINSYNGN